jgi:hypothetical protein
MKKSRFIFASALTATIGIGYFSHQAQDLVYENHIQFLIDSINGPQNFNGLTIDKPILTENLQIFPIKGKSNLNSKKYLALNNALADSAVVLKETGAVNELMIDNNSDSYVYIQSGDIVKGGRQDRTIQYDVILPPKSKGIALSSFCVEKSRWSKRAGESDAQFADNTSILSTRELKAAAKIEKSQSKVWSKVDTVKSKLNTTLPRLTKKNIDVNDNASYSSLQLTLETKDLELLKDSIRKIVNAKLDEDGVIGFVYAINGEIYGADYYNNENLFNDLQKKLVNSVVVEAISELDTIKRSVPKTVEILNYLNTMEKEVTENNEIINSETNLQIDTHMDSASVKFTTNDSAMNNEWLHVNYINLAEPIKNESEYGIDFSAPSINID